MSDIYEVMKHASAIAKELNLPTIERKAFLESIRLMARDMIAAHEWKHSQAPSQVNGAEQQETVQ